jgi:2-polyprenyl-6-methoxyphenol hydroxylase-like FAD-dependent oxidoreductase
MGLHANNSTASAGLTVAAYLQDCGIRALVIEREQRVGDVWRKRYKVRRLPTPGTSKVADNNRLFDSIHQNTVIRDRSLVSLAAGRFSKPRTSLRIIWNHMHLC